MMQFVSDVAEVAFITIMVAQYVTLCVSSKTAPPPIIPTLVEDLMHLDPFELRDFVWRLLCTGPPKRTLAFARSWNAQADKPNCSPQDVIDCLQELEGNGYAITDGFRWYLSPSGIMYRDAEHTQGR